MGDRDAKIAEAAIRWVRLRDHARELRNARGNLLCHKEIGAVVSSGGEVEFIGKQEQPCWRETRFVAPDDFEPIPREEWCDTCRTRQEIHETLRSVSASRGAALRTLARRAREAGRVQ